MRLIFILTFGIFSFSSFSQSAIDITETTIKITALDEQEIYYGFCEGDKLIFNFEEVNGKELKEIEIMEMPTTSRFSDFKSKKIENKIIDVPRTGIYKFRFYNSSLGGRVCKFKIQRIPASEKTKKFNSSVFWKTIKDTTYTPTEEKYLIKKEYVSKDIYSSNPQVSSQNAFNGNKNYQVVDFDLPENTVSWSFYIGTGNESAEEYERARMNFAQKAVEGFSKFSVYGPMASLALTGVSYFNKVQGKDNVKYWFLSDANSVTLFQTNKPFYSYKKGDVINEASQVLNPLKGKVYLALLNDNTVDPIQVTIKVTAIQLNEEWGTRTVQAMSVSEREEPYLKN